jgi:hypothetical protein
VVVMRTAGFQRRGDFDVGFASDDFDADGRV